MQQTGQKKVIAQDAGVEAAGDEEESKYIWKISLTDMFNLVVYVNKTKRTLQKIIEELKLTSQTRLIEEVNHMSRSTQVPENRRVFVPGYSTQEGKFQELLHKDVEESKLEERCMNMSDPRFLVSVPFKDLDIYGVLVFKKEFLHFKPFNPLYCGTFNYDKNDHLHENTHLEFSVNYADINVDEPIVMPMPSNEPNKLDEFPINFSALLTLYRTGYYKTADDHKEFINGFRTQRLGIAQINLKVPNYNSRRQKRNNDKREEIANNIHAMILQGSSRQKAQLEANQIPDTKGEFTTISIFDIMYESLIPELEQQDGSKIGNVNKSIDLLKKAYGFKDITNVRQIENQSLFPLEFSFPELGKQISFEELQNRKGGLMADYILPDFSRNILETPSKIISLDAAGQVKKHLPGYLRAQGWRLVYSSWRDGTSLTLFKHLVVKKGPCVILVQDYKNNVFGGFLNEDFEYTHTQYKGSAECFLFKWKFEKDKRILKPFLATFQNEFFFYASSDGFGFGADPNYGLFVDKEILRGLTYSCVTFNNEILSHSNHFKVKNLEIWSLKSEDIY